MPGFLLPFCEQLAQTPFSTTLRDIEWIIPLLQTIHILCIAAVMGSIVMIDLRLLGVIAPSQTVAAMAKRLLPATWIALCVLLVTGSLLAVAEPARSLANPAFQIKMALLIVVLGLTLFLRPRLHRDSAYWAVAAHRVTGNTIAVVSLLIWLAIIFAGRWIAYVDLSGAA